jgi:hypothetical protein
MTDTINAGFAESQHVVAEPLDDALERKYALPDKVMAASRLLVG